MWCCVRGGSCGSRGSRGSRGNNGLQLTNGAREAGVGRGRDGTEHFKFFTSSFVEKYIYIGPTLKMPRNKSFDKNVRIVCIV